MPIIKSARKRMRQDQRRYAQNLRVKRTLRDATKAFTAKPTFEAMQAVQSQIDTAVKKNIIKKNTGARRMARISRLAKAAGVKIPAKKPAVKPKTTPSKAKPAATKPKTAAEPKAAPKKAPAKKPTTKK